MLSGNIKIKDIFLRDDIYDNEIMVQFWISATQSSSVWFRCKNKEIVDCVNNPEGKIEITFKEKTIKLQALESSCKKCKKYLCCRVYSRTKSRGDNEGEYSGWITIGNTIFENSFYGKDLKFNLISYDIQLFYKIQNFYVTGMVQLEELNLCNQISVDKIIFPIQVPKKFLLKDDEKIKQNPGIFLKSDNKRILEYVVATHHGFWLRENFYIKNDLFTNYDDEFFETMLRFGFLFHGYKIEILNKFIFDWNNNKNNDLSFELQNISTVLVLCVAYYITRYKYMEDGYLVREPTNDGENIRDFEQFSKSVLLLGGGDCEDLAWTSLTMFEYIKKRKPTDKNYPYLNFATKLIQLYVPVNALVQASAPQMKPKKDSKVNNLFQFSTFTLENESNIENEYKFYHMTCFLLPEVRFFKTRRGADYLKSRKEESNMNKLVCEGTSCTFPITNLKIDELTEQNCNYLQSLINDDRDPIVTFTGRNFDGATIMFGTVVQLASEYFMKKYNSSLVLLNVTRNNFVYEGPQELDLEETHDFYIEYYPMLNPYEDELLVENSKFLRSLEPPAVLKRNLKNFSEEDIDKKLSEFKPNAIIHNWEWIKKNPKSTDIPYYPYNNYEPNKENWYYLRHL